ncbi:hypothetical protein ACMAZF_08835 [Psychrobium sp. nBUS_13]|uniref:hypothetical protein n=1 Tax=Psychrobium sp. nBUS_13 TaxID=3395319 RepID=UPI003EB81838
MKDWKVPAGVVLSLTLLTPSSLQAAKKEVEVITVTYQYRDFSDHFWSFFSSINTERIIGTAYRNFERERGR